MAEGFTMKFRQMDGNEERTYVGISGTGTKDGLKSCLVKLLQ
jgi:hypothetical protein